jgi:hypothetical protein
VVEDRDSVTIVSLVESIVIGVDGVDVTKGLGAIFIL